MLRPAFNFPPWLPGFLSYSFLFVINVILVLIAAITLDDVATGLEVILVICNSLASFILIATLFYKMLVRSCVFNEVKYDWKVLFCVALLDGCAAVGWSIRLHRSTLCTNLSGSTDPCYAAPIAVGLAFAWISAIVACCAAARAHHGKKGRKPSPLPIYVSRPVISSPLIIHAGSFSENEREDNGMLTSFANVPLEDLGGTRG